MTEGDQATARGVGAYLLADADFPWPDAEPYETLNRTLTERGRPTISPASGQHEINDAYYDLMDTRSQSIRKAWDVLRIVPTRAMHDFFHYPATSEDPGPPGLDALNCAMPRARLDLVALADSRPDLAILAGVDGRLEFVPVLGRAEAPAGGHSRLRPDVWGYVPRLEEILGEADE